MASNVQHIASSPEEFIVLTFRSCIISGMTRWSMWHIRRVYVTHQEGLCDTSGGSFDHSEYDAPQNGAQCLHGRSHRNRGPVPRSQVPQQCWKITKNTIYLYLLKDFQFFFSKRMFQLRLNESSDAVIGLMRPFEM